MREREMVGGGGGGSRGERGEREKKRESVCVRETERVWGEERGGKEGGEACHLFNLQQAWEACLATVYKQIRTTKS